MSNGKRMSTYSKPLQERYSSSGNSSTFPMSINSGERGVSYIGVDEFFGGLDV